MNYMTTKEASEKWGYSEATICKWCREDKLSVVCRAEKKKSGRWQIPINTQCPKPIKARNIAG